MARSTNNDFFSTSSSLQIAPYFVLMLNDTIALEHEKVEFKVKVLGTPKPTIQWFKDDLEVGYLGMSPW